MSKYDVVIVGGGPAGAICARCVAENGLEVALVEAGDFTGVRPGETISPSARHDLVQQGVALDGDHGHCRLSQAILSSWGSGELIGSHHLANPYGTGCVVDRNWLDHSLFKLAVGSGVDGRTCSRVTAAQPGGPGGMWHGEIKDGGGSAAGFSARFLVVSTGRKGSVAGTGSPRKHYSDRLIATTVSGAPSDCPAEADKLSCIVIEATRVGWWYTAWLPSGDMLATFFTDDDYLPRTARRRAAFVLEQLERTTHTRRRFSGNTPQVNRTVDVRSYVRDDSWGKSLYIGDAAVACDPLSGEGLSRSIASGRGSADAISICLADGSTTAVERFRSRCDQIYRSYLASRGGAYGAETRWAREPFWRRRNQTLN